MQKIYTKNALFCADDETLHADKYVHYYCILRVRVIYADRQTSHADNREIGSFQVPRSCVLGDYTHDYLTVHTRTHARAHTSK